MDGAQYDYNQDSNSWSGSVLSRIMSFSFLASFLNGQGYAQDSLKLLILGTVIETGRRLCSWFVERFQFQYSITAQFSEGDPAYEWIILFLTKLEIYQRSREFRVSSASSLLKWSINLARIDTHRKSPMPIPSLQSKSPDSLSDGHAEYVPTYEAPQLFRWKGYLMEIKRFKGMSYGYTPPGMTAPGGTMYLTIYTRDMSVLSSVVEAARDLYLETSKPHVIVHSADQPTYGPVFNWSKGKRKLRRPLSSIILQNGVIDSLLGDVKEFLETEDWYAKAGIPYRRGYLLYGPPGTGKTSTIYALAGHLGLEIYSISLASTFVDDSFLQRAVASIPKQAIFLIEDIDCAFPPRDAFSDANDPSDPSASSSASRMVTPYPYFSPPFPGAGFPLGRDRPMSQVTLSGLLNVLDGVGSEEGKLFFATTNHLEHLDAALLRPGRIDKKVQYHLAVKEQAEALFLRFFPEEWVGTEEVDEKATEKEKVADKEYDSEKKESKSTVLKSLATEFASHIPADEFSTAELQGYLLGCKKAPLKASRGVQAWVAHEREEREKLRAGLVKKKTEGEKGKDGEEKGIEETKEKEVEGAVEGGKVPSTKNVTFALSPPTTTGAMVGPSSTNAIPASLSLASPPTSPLTLSPPVVVAPPAQPINSGVTSESLLSLMEQMRSTLAEVKQMQAQIGGNLLLPSSSTTSGSVGGSEVKINGNGHVGEGEHNL